MEVLGRYSNLCDQGERLRTLLGIVPEGPLEVNLRAPKQVQHRLEDAEVDELKKAYESGATLWELACDFRVHKSTVMELLERNRVARRGNGLSDSQIAEAIRLYRKGQSTAVIGKSLGFSANTIRNRLIDADVEIRNPHDWHRRT